MIVAWWPATAVSASGTLTMPRESLWQRYLRALREHPIRTKSLTAAFITGLGSYLGQNLQRALTDHDGSQDRDNGADNTAAEVSQLEARLSQQGADVTAAREAAARAPSASEACADGSDLARAAAAFAATAAALEKLRAARRGGAAGGGGGSAGAGAGIDWRRVFAYGLFGLVCTGPAVHAWFNILAKFGPKNILLKVAVDRTVFHVPFQYFFFLFVGAVEGRQSFAAVRRHADKIIWPVMLKAWQFWPFVMLFSFRYVPIELRPLVGNLAALCWSIFLAYRAAMEKKRAALKDE